jgi:hypothetical protein
LALNHKPPNLSLTSSYDYRCGSNGRAPVLQVQSPKFKHVTPKKKKKKKEKEKNGY